jgi:hypothetical protein
VEELGQDVAGAQAALVEDDRQDAFGSSDFLEEHATAGAWEPFGAAPLVAESFDPGGLRDRQPLDQCSEFCPVHAGQGWVGQRPGEVRPGCGSFIGEVAGEGLGGGEAQAWSRPGVWGLQRGDTDASTGRHLYATNPNGTVVSLNPLTGKWQYQLAGATHVLAVATSRVFADCGSLGVCAYSIASGSRQWNEQPGSATDLAASAGGVLYLDQGLALNTGTGATMATLWAGSQASALAVGNGRIAVVTAPAGQVLKLYGLSGY